MHDVERNLHVVHLWERYYNEDLDRFVNECCAPDVEARAMGSSKTLRGRTELRYATEAVLRVAPHRRLRVDRTHASGDVVVVEAVFLDATKGADWLIPFCAVLTFRDGQIVSDRTYFDSSQWPELRKITE